MKTLNVIKTSIEEITERWGFYPALMGISKEYYIRCNQKGEINWEKAPVYTWGEIEKEKKKRRVCFLIPKELQDEFKNV